MRLINTKTNSLLKQSIVVGAISGIISLSFFLPVLFQLDGTFILKADYVQQQIPFYYEARNIILHGGSYWSFNTFLGTDFIGSYAFYVLGSPFFWLSLLLPVSWIPNWIAFSLWVKIVLSTVTAFLYVRRYIEGFELAVAASLLWSFSGNLLVSLPFHFYEVYALFPLLLLALENELAGENKFGLVLVGIISAFASYYFFASEIVFCTIYVFLAIITGKCRQKVGKLFIRLTVQLLICIMVAAILILPATAYSLDGYRAVLRDIQYTKMDYITMFLSIMMPNIASGQPTILGAGWSNTAAYMPIWGGMCVFVFILRKDGYLKDIRKILFIVAIILSSTPILNVVFTGFKGTASQHRWWFMFLLPASVVTIEIATDHFFSKARRIALIFMSAFYIGSIILVFKYKDIFFYNRAVSITDKYILSIGLIGLLFAFLWEIIFIKLKWFSARITLLVMISLLCSILGNTYIQLNNKYVNSEDVFNYKSANVYSHIVTTLNDSSKLPGKSSLERWDAPPDLLNLSDIIHRPSIMGFHSLNNAEAMKFASQIKIASSPGAGVVIPDLERYYLRSFLSVRWGIDTSGNTKAFLDNTVWKQAGVYNGFSLYENKLYIPFGYGPEYYLTMDKLKGVDQDTDKLLLKAIIIDDEQEEFIKQFLKPIPDNEINLPLNIEQTVEKLKQSSSKSTKVEGSTVTMEFKSDEKKVILFTLPYSDRWKATVDGRNAEIMKVDFGLMSITLPKGEHVVSLKYYNPMVIYGATTSIIGLICMIVWIFIEKSLDTNKTLKQQNGVCNGKYVTLSKK